MVWAFNPGSHGSLLPLSGWFAPHDSQVPDHSFVISPVCCIDVDEKHGSSVVSPGTCTDVEERPDSSVVPPGTCVDVEESPRKKRIKKIVNAPPSKDQLAFP